MDAKVAAAEAHLFKPQDAYRVRWNTNTDTPLPPDEPAGMNPPEGAIIDYVLGAPATGPVTLEITTVDGKPVRQYSSADPATRPDPATSNLPLYWFRPPMTLKTDAGMHRFTWDMHYQPLLSGGGGRGGGGGLNLPIAAVPFNTVPVPGGPWVAPGSYTAKLTVNGKSYSQPITVKQDPRVKTPALVMQQVYSLTRSTYEGARDAQQAAHQAQSLRDQIAKLDAKGATKDSLSAFDEKLKSLVGPPGGRGGTPSPFGPAPVPPPTPGTPDSLADASSVLAAVMNSLASDMQPTALQLKTIADAQARAGQVMTRWAAAKTQLALVNEQLRAAALPALEIK
jgi:hypothetical protein